ncbi:ABC transporter permease [Alkalihalobacillus pseudalcaliphilus]|uniref:ABC transporter permease n=1 Tax=Alkalihalobacillus pseudalcaliphilus TaxID=79884 RepID=UPI00064DCA73|nr:ABC transporter permease [Alkalihalobacillus pseudalcaliphilus]KMK76777.1 multidrug ABC transporter permease [Alkalihalobacillus pseudalcaliphilus]
MFAVFKAQLKKDIRSPWTILLLTLGSIILTFVFTNTNEQTETIVPIFSSESNREEVEEKWIALLNDSQNYSFIVTDEEKARSDVEEGNSGVAIQVSERDYKMIASSHTRSVQFIEDYVHTVFTREAQLDAATGSGEVGILRDEVITFVEGSPFQVVVKSVDGGDVPEYNMMIQLLFGFTLFMAMFTIGFKVNAVTSDKVSGVWDRMILSPLSKTGMYAGHLFYSFFIGFMQILTVLVMFHYFLDYDLGHRFGMIVAVAAIFALSMVSVAMLLTGFIKTPEQFNMIYPSIIPIVPLISGVYMPPGVLSNPVLLFIADLFPLAHAMEALMDITLYNAGWNEITLSLVLMLLIGVICMGIGVNLVERRKD